MTPALKKEADMMDKPNYSRQELLDMYFHLVYARLFTVRMFQAVNDGLIRISYHTCYGEEATSVGVVSALKKTDWIVPSHRTQPVFLMRMDRYKFVAELFGRRDGQNFGAAYDFHLCDMTGPARLGVSIGTLGSVVPMYVGFAWALKQQKKDEIVVLYHGDGGMSEGTCFEAMNIAALYDVPMVLVIDNNKWAMTTPISRQTVNPVISERGDVFHIPRQVVDGSDILAIRAAMDKAVALARGNQFNIVEIMNERWGPHYIGQNTAYRDDTDAIKDAMENKDAVRRFEQYLLDSGVIDAAHIEKTNREITEEIEAHIAKAAACENPRFEDIYVKAHIYVSPETGGDL
jgi:pyruvate dehydrogenase E1 component alpha subunit